MFTKSIVVSRMYFPYLFPIRTIFCYRLHIVPFFVNCRKNFKSFIMDRNRTGAGLMSTKIVFIFVLLGMRGQLFLKRPAELRRDEKETRSRLDESVSQP